MGLYFLKNRWKRSSRFLIHASIMLVLAPFMAIPAMAETEGPKPASEQATSKEQSPFFLRLGNTKLSSEAFKLCAEEFSKERTQKIIDLYNRKSFTFDNDFYDAARLIYFFSILEATYDITSLVPLQHSALKSDKRDMKFYWRQQRPQWEKGTSTDRILPFVDLTVGNRLEKPDPLPEGAYLYHKKFPLLGLEVQLQALLSKEKELAALKNGVNRAEILLEAVAKSGYEGRVQELMRLQKSENNRVAWDALNALEKIASPETTDFFIDLIENDPSYRLKAMSILGAFPPDKKIDRFLVKYLSDDDVRLRIKALRALSDRQSPILEKHLGDLLQDKENIVRSAAIDAMGVVKAPKLYDQLLALKDGLPEGVLPRYFIALGNTGGEQAVSVLLPEARTWTKSLQNAETEQFENLSVAILQSIMEGLILTESDAAVSAMAEIYRLGDLRIKNLVVFSLSKSGVESAMTVLDVLLEETENEALRNSIHGAKRRLSSNLKSSPRK